MVSTTMKMNSFPHLLGAIYTPECRFPSIISIIIQNITYHHQTPIWFSRLTNSLNGDFSFSKSWFAIWCPTFPMIPMVISHDVPDEISRSGQRRAQLEVVDRFSRGAAGGFSGRMLPSGNLTFLMGKIWGKYMGNMMIYWIRINYEYPLAK